MSLDVEQELNDIANVIQNATSIQGDLEDDYFEQTSVHSGSNGTNILHSEDGDWEENDDWEASSDIGEIARKDEADTRELLRQDLRIAKEAGFRVGYLGSLDGIFVVSLACRVSRLGINEDVMQAWDIKPSEYLVLLIHYSSSYRSFAEILQMGGKQRSAIQLHVGLCDSYKPDFEHAFKIFKEIPAQRGQVQDDMTTGTTGYQLRPLFIEDSLNGFLNERFLAIIHSRWRIGLSWKGAELFTHHNQGKPSDCCVDLGEEYFEPDVSGDADPDFLIVDHMAACNGDASQMSLPLLAMQFTLRHFVYCTKFCLVCHCRLEVGFESLKPFVCSNALCLYQYMLLGMGTTLEYEIRSEPYVVDLLISLTYSRAVNKRLDDFPSGLRLMVPGKFPGGSPVRVSPKQMANYPRAIFKPASFVIHFDTAHPFKVGDWVVLKEQAEDGSLETHCWHCRVQSHDYPGTLQLSHPTNEDSLVIQEESQPRDQLFIEVRVIPYNRNFDELGLKEKQHMIPQILDTLPPVDEMTTFLGNKSTKTELSAWKDRISPAALDILRWIVASNRSYIKLDDPRNSENKVTGMDDFIQFRLVQGAPDKEHEFTNAVFKHGRRACPDYPTVFAWHGSPLHSWHSILRDGLNFEYVVHGRRCGDGVYFSSSFREATTYTKSVSSSTQLWRNSKLNIQSVVSLNEIVNDPGNFVHSRDCLVVNRLDWFQPRFLFVRSRKSPFDDPSNPPVETPVPVTPYKQDPSRLVNGPTEAPIKIPASAFGIRKWEGYYRNPGRPTINLHRKRKRDTATAITDSNNADDDEASIATDPGDLEILLSDNESVASKENTPETTDTEFTPGTLTEESLPLMAPPTYASTSTTNLLQRHLQATLKVQENEDLQTVGWYIDPNLITTVYQWIVEMHSFDPTLPLAQDLKKGNMQSVVLEFRFGPGFPMSPPFVRVIRPQFLDFSAGGGGHVTTGGAFCLELLTNSGWLPSMSIESVLLQVRMALCSLDPHPARIALASRQRDYSAQGAVEAYRRACRAHGWFAHNDISHIS